MSTAILEWPISPVACATPAKPAPAESGASTDEELVTSTLGGDGDSFSELIRRYKRRVFASAARFARDDHQLDDICQEVFVRAFRNLSKFRGEAPFQHWLSRITVSACYDFLRKERRSREQVSLDGAEWDLRDYGTEAAIAAGRARELIAWALPKLTADEQLILTLCELDERSVREVAELTGWSESNVKVRAFRARQSLKKILRSAMNNNSDVQLDALFAAARAEVQDTSRVEFGFETRVMARLREESNPLTAMMLLAWRLCPFFAALAIAAGIWSRTPSVRAEAGAQLFTEVARSGEEQVLLAYLTGDDQ